MASENTNEKWIALSSVVIALIALIFSIWEGRSNKQHQKLLVKPNVTISFNMDDEEKEIGWYLKNSGVGAGKIRSFNATVSKEIIKSFGKKEFKEKQDNRVIKDQQISSLTELLKIFNIIGLEERAGELEGTWIGSGETIPLLILKKGLVNGSDNLLIAIDKNLKFKTCYCSLYEDCWLFEKFHIDPKQCKSKAQS